MLANRNAGRGARWRVGDAARRAAGSWSPHVGGTNPSSRSNGDSANLAPKIVSQLKPNRLTIETKSSHKRNCIVSQTQVDLTRRPKSSHIRKLSIEQHGLTNESRRTGDQNRLTNTSRTYTAPKIVSQTKVKHRLQAESNIQHQK